METKNLNKPRKYPGKYILRAVTVFILCLFSFATIFPVIFTLNSSLKTDKEWTASKFTPPVPPTIENYKKAWKNALVPRTFLNSVITTAGGALGTLIVCVMAAYAATKSRFKGRNIIFIFLLSTMMMPLQTILYPFFKIMSNFKLVNNYMGLIIAYVTFGIPLTLYQLASYFKRIPNELIESARIDGASTFQIILHIIFPVARPVIVTVTLINCVWMWNELLLPLMVMRTSSMQTLTVALSIIRGQWGATPPSVSAGVILGIIPIAITYFFAQRQIIKGMTFAAVKG